MVRMSVMTCSRHPVLSICFALLLAWNCKAREARPYAELTYPKLRDIPTQNVQRLTLSNGLRLFLLEDHELPLVQMFALIRVGSRDEPVDKAGLVHVLGKVLRSGGTTSLSGDQINMLLEQNAASLEIHTDFDSSHVLASVLRGGEGTLLDVLADILTHPGFSRDQVHLAKLKLRNLSARHPDDPTTVAIREFSTLIYGANSIYTRQPRSETIERITRDDLVAFHRRFIGANSVLLGIWGDFDTAQMVDRVGRVFAGWGPVALWEPAKPEIHQPHRPRVYLIRKQDANQSTILLGHSAGMMNDVDYAALVVMNKILGGDFTGRLFRTVRSREGLSYVVSGEYSCGFDYPGLFFVGCRTKSSTTGKAIRAMLKEIRNLTASPVTDTDLALAKENYQNAFVFEFDNQADIVRRLMTYEYHGYPTDFLERTRVGVEKVTTQDVLRAAQRHVYPDEIQILVIGCPEDFDEPLSVFGEVTEGPPHEGA